MFGYVLPSKEKLSEEQWKNYRATYCGLCHTLKRRYGFLAQFLLNYDFTFLALLLRTQSQKPTTCCKKCLSSPIKGRTVCDPDPGLDSAADISVLLVYWKLKDQLQDEKGVHRILPYLELGLFHRAFSKAKQKNPELNDAIGLQITALSALEQENCSSIDRTADCFAKIMTAMVPKQWDDLPRRSMEQLLYHLGRWIYLIDAWDDLDDDLKHGQYNPVVSRFRLTKNSDPIDLEQAKEQMIRTVEHSENLAISAYHLGDFGYNDPLVENILCAGLGVVRTLVFSGEWKKRYRQKKQELNQV